MELTLQSLTTADFLKAEAQLSIEQKSALAAGLAAALNTSGGDFAEAEAILRLIIWNAEPRVIEFMALAAAGNPNTPHDVAWALANDDEAAATPILRASIVLSETDLVAIVESSGNFLKMGAIAERVSVGEGLSRSLAQHGDEAAVHLLLRNAGAEIPDDAYASMLDRHGQHELIQAGIIDRSAISPAIAERLASMVGTTLAEKLAARHRGPATRSSGGRTIGLIEEFSAADWDEILSQMVAEKSITASFLTRKLCQGGFDFFCRALGAVSQTPKDEISAGVLDSAIDYLPDVWKKASLPAAWLPVVWAAIAALVEIDKKAGTGDAEVFRRNIVDRTQAILKAEKYVMNDAQKSFFKSL